MDTQKLQAISKIDTKDIQKPQALANVKSAETEAQKATQPIKKVEEHKGTDVSKQVTVIYSKIEGFKAHNVIRPHHGQGGRMNYALKIPSSINPRDQFKIQLSDNINTHGVSVERKAASITTSRENNIGDVIATGQVSEDGKTITYTFTDYVKNKQNITANLSLSYFVNYGKVQQSGNQLITTTIGDTKTSRNIYVYYDNSKYVDGRITELNKKEGTFKHIAYVNHFGYWNGHNTVYVSGHVTQGSTTGQPKIKVYKYIGEGYPPESVYLEKGKWAEVSLNSSNIRFNDYGSYSLSLDVSKNQRYAIKYVGNYDSNVESLLYKTYAQSQYSYWYSKVNGVKFYENNANGNGELRPIPPQPEPKPLPEPEPKPQPEPEPKPLPEPEPKPQPEPEPKPLPEPEPKPQPEPEPKPLPEPEPKPYAPITLTPAESNMKQAEMKPVKQVTKAKVVKSTSEKELPNTGGENNHTPWYAGLLVLVGTALLFRRKNKHE
ncbi:Ig-like domain-containing protein [Staphylococcus ratti]|uniref:Ig-like domain-containing protein n=2 Tax=Staphylococcus ratti TaxID=2892440 RepID=A0ABY3PFW8_9STAP|nr:Ig-like domain-containing protein [Staphylococcus ratti]